MVPVPVAILRSPLSLPAAYRLLTDPESGGIALFAGRVRADARPGGRVHSLLYEADERLALAYFARISELARHRFGARRVVVWHRVGELPVGAISVVVGVAAPHREAAFAAARYLIDSLKKNAPIWKTDRVARSGRAGGVRPRTKPRGRRTTADAGSNSRRL